MIEECQIRGTNTPCTRSYMSWEAQLTEFNRKHGRIYDYNTNGKTNRIEMQTNMINNRKVRSFRRETVLSASRFARISGHKESSSRLPHLPITSKSGQNKYGERSNSRSVSARVLADPDYTQIFAPAP